MKKYIKKIMLMSTLLTIMLIIFVINRPAAIRVESRYSPTTVPQIIFDTGDLDSGVPMYTKISENDFLALYFNYNNSYFAVKDKRNDYTWFSNVTQADPLARTESQRNLQRSTIQINYLQRDNTVGTMNNFSFSINYKRDFDDAFTVDVLSNGFRVNYHIVNREPRGYWFPPYISKDRFMELVYEPVQLFGNQFDRRQLDQYYGPSEDDPETYVIRQLRMDEETGLFNMNDLSGAQVQTLFRLFYNLGYYGNKTDEDGNYIDEYHLDDVAYDNEQYDIFIVTEQPEFIIPLEVRLHEDHLDVRVNYFGIEQFNDFDLLSLRLLPYFGAIRNEIAGEPSEGYLVIPEGSGGLIRFNNKKTTPISYSTYIYGRDLVAIPEIKPISDVGASLPIFGIKTTNNAMLGIIENGAPHSRIRSDVSEKVDSYNKIYNEFLFRESGSYQLADNQVTIWNREEFVYSPNIKYYFFEGEEANYVHMAQLYGEYLRYRHDLEVLSYHKRRFIIDILGSYEYDDFFLWFPVTKTGTLTTYDQANTLIEELHEAGLNDIAIRYQGWFNGGIEHSVPNQITLDNELGSRRQFNRFNEELSDLGISVFYDVDFIKTHDSSAFYTSRNYARVIGGRAARFYDYDLATRRQNLNSDPYYISNISAIDRNTSAFLSRLNRYPIDAISLRHLGNMVYSDFRNNGQVSRIQNQIYLQHIMAKFNDYDVMLSNPHVYALPFVDLIVDLETRTSDLVVVDESIPFYQLAIAKYIEYTTPSYNMEDRYQARLYLLHAIETGSNLKVTLSYENPTILENTKFLDFYATYYQNNKDFIIELNNNFNELGIENSYLVNHEILAENVVRVTYSHNQQFIINYNAFKTVVDGVEIEAYQFVKIGGQ